MCDVEYVIYYNLFLIDIRFISYSCLSNTDNKNAKFIFQSKQRFLDRSKSFEIYWSKVVVFILMENVFTFDELNRFFKIINGFSTIF